MKKKKYLDFQVVSVIKRVFILFSKGNHVRVGFVVFVSWSNYALLGG